MPKAVAVIPARLDSTRLPRKMLLAETGHPLIVHTWMQARRARRLAEVVVATDAPAIADAVTAAGGRAVITRSDHRTGSDRIGEVLPTLDADVIVNVQGDEPEIEPTLIDALVERLHADAEIDVATAATPILTADAFHNPNYVKVVADSRGRALYFSRSPIPGSRPADADVFARGHHPLLHVGVYAYRRAALETFLRLGPSALETIECLEQLRLIENGSRFGLVIVESAPRGIDTADDYALFVRRARGGAPSGPDRGR